MLTDNNPSEPKTNHQIWTLLDNTHYAIARARLLEIARFGLTKEQAQILYIIQNNGGSATLGEIANYTVRQHHSISTLIKRMIKVGLVKRVKLANEKAFKVMATTKGKEAYGKLTRASIDFIFASVTAEEKEQLIGTFSKLQKSARNLLGLDRNLLLESVPSEETAEESGDTDE
jgi:DNA-binding MarR family transcriptional regulator